MAPLGKMLFALGALAAALGLVLWAGSGLPLVNRFGRLPGDLYLRRGHLTLYFPLTSAILVSLVIALLLAWMRR